MRRSVAVLKVEQRWCKSALRALGQVLHESSCRMAGLIRGAAHYFDGETSLCCRSH